MRPAWATSQKPVSETQEIVARGIDSAQIFLRGQQFLRILEAFADGLSTNRASVCPGLPDALLVDFLPSYKSHMVYFGTFSF